MIVRRGSPFIPNQSPLTPTVVDTIRGTERFGGRRGPVAFGKPRLMRGLGGTGSISIRNLSGGSNTSFKVGDRWQISISGSKPNAMVFLNASVCSADFSRCAELPRSGQQDIAATLWSGSPNYGSTPLANTDAAGNATMSGTFTPAQVGVWTQTWNVAGADMLGLQLSVADVSGSSAYQGPVVPIGTPYYQQLGQQPPIIGPLPDLIVHTLDQQLAGRVASISSGSQVSGRVSLTNLTSGDASHFVVGDQWRIAISGALPNSPVTVVAYQDGRGSTTPMGSTDGAGNWSTHGAMDASTVGSWSEQWRVGVGSVGQLSFTVVGAGGGASSNAPASSGSYQPVVKFSSPHGASLLVGDQWTVTITGASPNAPVSVTGIFNGSTSTSAMGTTDANGTFAKTGTATADLVGNWTESWTAGGLNAGSFSFTVSKVGGGSPAVNGSAPPAHTSGGGGQAPAGTFDVGALLGESVFMGIPNWILLAAVGGAFLLFGGKR